MFIANLWRSLSDGGTHKKKKSEQLSFILIYYLLGIIFLLGWGLGVSETEGRRNETGRVRKGWREGGPQGFGDSWHKRERETGRRRDGRQERDNVTSVFKMLRVFL